MLAHCVTAVPLEMVISAEPGGVREPILPMDVGCHLDRQTLLTRPRRENVYMRIGHRVPCEFRSYCERKGSRQPWDKR